MDTHVLYPDFDEDRLLRFRSTYERAVYQCSGLNKVSRAYCILAGEQEGLKSNRDMAHKGRVALNNLMKAKKIPTAERAWNAFEAFRTAGVPWASGVVGLHAAEHFAELIGLYYALGKCAWSHTNRDVPDLRPFLSDLAFAGTASTRTHNLRSWDDFASIEEACASVTLSNSRHAQLRTAWSIWQGLPHDLSDLCSQYRDFPIAEYAVVSDLRHTALYREMVIQNYARGRSLQ